MTATPPIEPQALRRRYEPQVIQYAREILSDALTQREFQAWRWSGAVAILLNDHAWLTDALDRAATEGAQDRDAVSGPRFTWDQEVYVRSNPQDWMRQVRRIWKTHDGGYLYWLDWQASWYPEDDLSASPFAATARHSATWQDEEAHVLPTPEEGK